MDQGAEYPTGYYETWQEMESKLTEEGYQAWCARNPEIGRYTPETEDSDEGMSDWEVEASRKRKFLLKVCHPDFGKDRFT